MSIITVISAHGPELSGFLIPPVVEYISRDVHIEEERFIVFVLICIFWAAFLHIPDLINGQVDHYISSFTRIFFEAKILWQLYFKNSVLRTKLKETINDKLE